MQKPALSRFICLYSILSDFEFEAELEEALGSETCFGKHCPVAVEVYLSSDRHDLESAVCLGIVVALTRLHVREFYTQTEFGIEGDDAVAVVVLASVHHHGMIGDVAVSRASFGSG